MVSIAALSQGDHEGKLTIPGQMLVLGKEMNTYLVHCMLFVSVTDLDEIESVLAPAYCTVENVGRYSRLQ
jgi:hypothetical protein